MATSPFVSVKKPISAWKKPLAASWSGLFKSLTSGISAGVTLQWDKLAESLIDMGSALGLDTPVEERVGALVLRALARAIAELVTERQDELPAQVGADADADAYIRHLDALLEAYEMEIGPDFFDRPASLELPAYATPIVADWFERHGVAIPDRAILETRLAHYFVYALMAEWRRRPAEYEPILAGVDTPFAAAGEREYAWHQYRAELQRRINQPMFGEPFGLKQVYIPLRAHYAPVLRDRRRGIFQPDPRIDDDAAHRRVVDLRSHLEDWLARRDRRDALRLVSGGPGSGKSSFAKWFAARLCDRYRVVMIPLFELDLGESLPAAIDEHMRRKGYPLHDLLSQDSHEDHALVIFDGLDELSLRGRLGLDAARHFMRQVERMLRDMNYTACRVQVLVTGRELAIQGAESEKICAPEHTIHVLPYYVREREGYDDPDDLLTSDQRDQWWQLFGQASGRGQLVALPDELKRKDLDEITAEPLLCYLVALGFSQGEIDLSQVHIDLGLIYRGLLRSVYKRNYEGRRHKSLASIDSFEDFAVILEEIGLAAWHSKARTTTISTIQQYCQKNRRLRKLLASFEAKSEAGVGNLLLAFYFRQSDHDVGGDSTYEFTHLSFREYLTARRIARTADRIADKLAAGDRGDEDGWDERQALTAWVEVCGPTAMAGNVVRFLDAEVEYRYNQSAPGWQSVGCHLIGHFLRHSMPMDEFKGLSFRDKSEWAQNAEVALFVLISACSRVTRQVNKVSWPVDTSFGTWLRRVVEQRAATDNPLVMERLFRLDLSHCLMDLLDLYETNLAYSDLSHANLQYANLLYANLRGAKLEGVNLHRANLTSAMLAGASLESAYMNGADLRHASLTGAKLAAAQLEEADLEQANLYGATLVGANLAGANLRDAELVGAVLAGANLAGAKLTGANLTFVGLADASLETADMNGADLRLASLVGANLAGAQLEEANLERANLRNAKLQGAKLYGARLAGAKLTKANLRGVWYSSTTSWPAGFDPKGAGCVLIDGD